MILVLGTTPALQRTMVFDRVRLDAVNRAASVTEYASGKPINAARVLRTIGRDVLVTGFLGGDTGRIVRQDLDRAGIPHDFHEVRPATRTCVTVVDRTAAQATELVEESARVDDADWPAMLEKLRGLLPRAVMLVMLGSLPPGAPQDFYAQCVALANAAGVRTILDAKGEPLRHALRERPFVIKPNRKELEETVGRPIESRDALQDAIAEVLREGPRWAVVTAGAEGAYVGDGQALWHLNAPSIDVVSPIGSGDAMAAGLAAALSEDLKLPKAAVLGVACAAGNARTPHAGHVDPADVERLRSLVHVQPI